MYAYDRAKQALMLETDRPIALREAILACRNGGTVSVIGVYGGFIDKFPMGAVMNRSLTIRTGQCHVQRYMKPLLERIQRGEIDPSFVITHRLPLEDAPEGYDMFLNKRDDCEKVVLKPERPVAALSGWQAERRRLVVERDPVGPRHVEAGAPLVPDLAGRIDRERLQPVLVTRLPHDPAGRAAEIRQSLHSPKGFTWKRHRISPAGPTAKTARPPPADLQTEKSPTGPPSASPCATG